MLRLQINHSVEYTNIIVRPLSTDDGDDNDDDHYYMLLSIIPIQE